MRRNSASKAVKVCLLCIVVCLLCGLAFFAGVVLSDARSIPRNPRESRALMSTAATMKSAPMQSSFELNSPLASRQQAGKEVVWLYSLITTDYDGPRLIPHFVKHYLGMGIPSERLYVDLLHDPALPNDGLKIAQELFRSVGAAVRIITHPYKPDLQDQAMMSGLAAMPMDIEDWIIVADMDELFTYGVAEVHEAVQIMTAEGATYAVGEMLDHVAPGGVLQHIIDGIDIWSQFPFICPVVSAVAKGLPAKVTIHKAFLRSGAGHHHIVHPPLARAYFSKECKGIPCELVMKRYKQRTLEDLYSLTPYSQHAARYAATGTSEGWHARRWSAWTKVHHFKWHASILDNLRLRMIRDSGDCELNVNEDSCQPKFQFWKEVALTFQELNATQSINITSLDCKEGVETLWNW